MENNFITMRDKVILQEQLRIAKKKLEESFASKEEAMKLGDLSENSEYDKANEDIRKFSREVMKLQESLDREVIATVDNKIGLGSKISLKSTNLETNEVELDGIYEIIATSSSSPLEGCINYDAPIVEYLKGKMEGSFEIVTLDNVKRRYDFKLEGSSK